MGCDIHLHTEVKLFGRWEHYSKVDVERSYRLFYKMAGVRGPFNDITPISKPRGVPDDISAVTKVDYLMGVPCDHSHSYLNQIEIVTLSKWIVEYIYNNVNAWRLPQDYWGYLFGNYWNDFVDHPELFPKDLEDIRFVFWFDN